MRDVALPEKANLPAFSWKGKARVVIGEDMRAVFARQTVERFMTSLGQQNGRSTTDGVLFGRSRVPPGAVQVDIGGV